jgi:YfiH family protein
MNTRVGTLVAVTGFNFRIYSVKEARPEFLQRFPDALVLNHVNADTNNHRCMLQANRVSQITVLVEPALTAIPGIVHGFSTRRAEHNAFTLGPSSSENPAIQINRTRFLDAVGMTGWPLLKLKQTHSNIVHDFKDTWAASQPVEGDGAITALGGAALGIQTADCVPILIADREARVVAAIHAGWRGTASRIAEKAIRQIGQAYGVAPEDLTAVIGPHNAVCCYEVGDEVVAAVNDPEAILRKPEWLKAHLNQALANKRQLMEAGIPETQILVSNLCTQCRADLFYSYRRDGERTGRMLSVIGILP